ncbi:MAG: ATP-binding protein [Xanthomonadales bacterium]|jgi:two-component system sensor histidine kinase QseC|nr:ATP-binding protein [Xanthomonadales bacterium]
MRRSLRGALLGTLLPMLAAAGIGAGALGYHDSLTGTNELFDAKLAQSARLLALTTEAHLDDGHLLGAVLPVPDVASAGEGDGLATASGHAYESLLALQVFDANGTLQLRSANADLTPLAPLRAGFDRVERADGRWRTYTLQSAGRWFQVGEHEHIRAELAEDIAFETLLPQLIALPLLALGILCIVGWATRGIGTVRRAVEARAPDALEPIPLEPAPRELHGLLDAFNDLLGRNRRLMAQERRFIADAAHELRTPISALKLHAQNLEDSEDPAARAESLDGLLRGLSRCERLVQQLLDLARAEAGGAARALGEVDLSALARDTLAELGPLALAAGRELALDADADHLQVRGDAVLLRSLLRNLVDNALKHGAGEVLVQLTRSPGFVTLTVEDAGSGLAVEERTLVLQAFQRGSNAQSVGSGLGLSIVQRICERHGAALRLDAPEDGSGLRVSVRLPVG